MSRNTRFFVVVGVAVLMAALASGGVYFVIMALPPRPVPVPTVDVVASAKRLDAGICVSKDDITIIKWPEQLKPAGTFQKVDDVIGRGLLTAGIENEPITETKVAERGAGCGLPPTISVGMRAMSVKVNEVIGVAGFVTPGTHVDVLVTLQNNSDSIARVVVRNVQVLTAGTRYDEAEAKAQNKAIPSTVVTLMVTPQDAVRITLAQSEGQIMLALRNPLDSGAPESPAIDKGELMGGLTRVTRPVPPVRQVAAGGRRTDGPPPPPPPPPTPPAAKPFVVSCAAGKCENVIPTWAAS
jgi:pilus assembly protein CpaB